MKELVFGRNLVIELGNRMNYYLGDIGQVSKAWEDNIGADKLANRRGHLMSSRTKHIGVKHHGFRDKVEQENLEIHMIKSKEQRADTFTKSLTRVIYEIQLILLMGW